MQNIQTIGASNAHLKEITDTGFKVSASFNTTGNTFYWIAVG